MDNLEDRYNLIAQLVNHPETGKLLFMEEAPICFAHHTVLFDQEGQPVDYRFDYINPAFERLLDVRFENVVGKTVLEVMPAVHGDSFDWIGFYARTARSGEKQQISQYSEALDAHFDIQAVSTGPDSFAVFFTDQTIQVTEKRLLEQLILLAENFIMSSDHSFDYQRLVNLVRDLSGARVAALHLIDNTRRSFYVKSISGDSEILTEMAAALNRDSIVGMNLKYPVELERQRYTTQVTVFDSLRVFARDSMSPDESDRMSKNLGIGQIAVSRILNENELIGTFTIFLKAGETLKNESMIRLLSRQTSLMMTRLRAEEEVSRLLGQFELVYNGTQDGLCLIRARAPGRYVYLNSNQAMRDLPGMTVQDMTGLEPSDVFDPETCTHQISKYDYCVEAKKPVSFEETIVLENESRQWAVTLTPVLQSGVVSHLVGSIRDITEERQQQAQIEYMSYHDQLTGLYNRYYFDDTLNRLDTPRNLPMSLIVMDVNSLKLANDVFGHAFGDDLLKAAAGLMTDQCRSDDIIARVGGDEFEIILPQTGREQVDSIVWRIRESMKKTMVGSLPVSISIGSATRLDMKEPLAGVRKKAEDRMYREKLKESRPIRQAIIDTVRSTLGSDHLENRHMSRTSEICAIAGKCLGLSDEDTDLLRMLGLVHDFGKIAISTEILSKPDKLNQAEWDEIHRHPELGYRIVSASDKMAAMADSVLNHHERWDGNGYPQGLSGNSIPLHARVLALADALEAMTSDRPWRSANSINYAIAEIKEHAGSQFDPDLAELFINEVCCHIAL